MKNSDFKIKLAISVSLALALILSFGIVTYALLTASVSVEDNSFRTGTVEINMNDGKPVIEEDDFSFEPGMTVVKDFFIENTGTDDAYYKVYFENVEGGLAEVLAVTVQSEEMILAQGNLVDLTADKVAAAEDILKAGEKRECTVAFYYPKEAGNSTADQDVTFDLSAQAVQVHNNSDKQFE